MHLKTPDSLGRGFSGHYLNSNFLLFFTLLQFSFFSQISAQFAIFQELFLPIGVETSANGDVWITHDLGSSTALSKFNSNGSLIGTVPIGNVGSVNTIGHLARLSNGSILDLFPDGRIFLFDENGNGSLLISLKQPGLSIKTNSIYDMASGRFSNMGGVILPQAPNTNYGDIAIVEEGNRWTLYITGASVNTYFFVLELVIDFSTNSASGEVLVSTLATTAPLATLSRGIAVNQDGIVLTTLPTNSGGPYDALVGFKRNFTSSNPPVFVSNVPIASLGMCTDPKGNFYIATGSVGTLLNDTQLGSGAVVVVGRNLDRFLDLIIFANSPTAVLQSSDVAVNPDGNRLYTTFTNQGVVTVSQIQIPVFPNLRVDLSQSSLEIKGNEIDVKLEVLNEGQASASQVEVDFFLLRNIPNPGPEDFLLLGRVSSGQLAPGNDRLIDFSVDVQDLDLDLIEGSSYFLVYQIDRDQEVDEDNEEDNIGLFENQLFELKLLTSSTNRLEELGEIVVFPNPSNGLVNVQTEKPFKIGDKLWIKDQRGQNIYQESFGSNQPKSIQLNLNHLPKGMYFIWLSSEGSRVSKKLLLH